MSETVVTATQILARRYLQIIENHLSSRLSLKSFLTYDRKTSLENLRWMCMTIDDNAETYPVDKLSRWLGYVQGVLAVRGLIDVDEERDFSRPLFHAAYTASCLPIPPTRSMTD